MIFEDDVFTSELVMIIRICPARTGKNSQHKFLIIIQRLSYNEKLLECINVTLGDLNWILMLRFNWYWRASIVFVVLDECKRDLKDKFREPQELIFLLSQVANALRFSVQGRVLSVSSKINCCQ